MAKKSTIDKLFREEFDDFSVVPPTVVWSGVEKSLQQKRKKKFVTVTLLWFALMGVASIFSFYIFNNKNDFKEKNINNQHFINNYFNNKKNNNSKEQNIDNQYFIKKDNNNINTSLKKDLKTNLATSIPSNKSSEKEQFLNNTTNHLTLPLQNNDYQKAQIKNIANKENKTSLFKEIKELNKDNKLNEVKEKSQAIEQYSNTVNPVTDRVEAAHSEGLKISFLPKLFFQNIDYQKNIKINNFNNIINSPISKHNFKLEKYVELYGGTAYAVRHLKAQSTEGSKLLQLRDSLEKYAFAYSFGGRFGVLHRSGISVRIGTEFSRTIEKLEYTNPQEMRSIKVIDDSTGLLIDKIIYGKYYKRVYNRLTYINIPIQIGYERMYKHWHLGVYSGLNLNLRFENKGEIRNLDSIFIPYDKTSGGFQTKAGLTLVSNAVLRYDINKNFAFHIEPTFSQQLSSLTKSDYFFSQKYTNFGVNLGLRYSW